MQEIDVFLQIVHLVSLRVETHSWQESFTSARNVSAF